jgi:hypothetical protein
LIAFFEDSFPFKSLFSSFTFWYFFLSLAVFALLLALGSKRLKKIENTKILLKMEKCLTKLFRRF